MVSDQEASDRDRLSGNFNFRQTRLLLHPAHRLGDDGEEAGGDVAEGVICLMGKGEELVVMLSDESRSLFHAERAGLALSLDLHQANVARLGAFQPGHTPVSV